jgi:hypothetical protein
VTGPAVHDVYAQYGHALHRAQDLERALLETLVLERLPAAAPVDPAQAEAFVNRQLDGTLGHLVRLLESCPSVPDDLRDLLREALSTRNWLVHDYLREHAGLLARAESRAVLVQELEAAGELFERALARAREGLRPLSRHARLLVL